MNCKVACALVLVSMTAAAAPKDFFGDLQSRALPTRLRTLSAVAASLGCTDSKVHLFRSPNRSKHLAAFMVSECSEQDYRHVYGVIDLRSRSLRFRTCAGGPAQCSGGEPSSVVWSNDDRHVAFHFDEDGELYSRGYDAIALMLWRTEDLALVFPPMHRMIVRSIDRGVVRVDAYDWVIPKCLPATFEELLSPRAACAGVDPRLGPDGNWIIMRLGTQARVMARVDIQGAKPLLLAAAGPLLYSDRCNEEWGGDPARGPPCDEAQECCSIPPDWDPFKR